MCLQHSATVTRLHASIIGKRKQLVDASRSFTPQPRNLSTSVRPPFGSKDSKIYLNAHRWQLAHYLHTVAPGRIIWEFVSGNVLEMHLGTLAHTYCTYKMYSRTSWVEILHDHMTLRMSQAPPIWHIHTYTNGSRVIHSSSRLMNHPAKLRQGRNISGLLQWFACWSFLVKHDGNFQVFCQRDQQDS